MIEENNQPIQDDNATDYLLHLGMLTTKAFAEGLSIGDISEISVDQREALYQLGYGFYNQNRLKEAFNIFSVLFNLEHTNGRYTFALASTCQALSKFEEAARYYSVAAVQLLGDPNPPFHAAECLLALKQTDLAAESLELVVSLSGEKKEHASIKSKADVLLKSIRESKVSS